MKDFYGQWGQNCRWWPGLQHWGAFKCQAGVFRFGPREQWVFIFFQKQSTWKPLSSSWNSRGRDLASLQDSVSVREQDCRSLSAVRPHPQACVPWNKVSPLIRQDQSLPNLISYILFVPSFCLLKACVLADKPKWHRFFRKCRAKTT